MKFKNGDYEVNYKNYCDQGYGVVSDSDTVTISIRDGEVVDCYSWGIHYITEKDINWTVNLEEEDCFDLIRSQNKNRLEELYQDEPEVDYDRKMDEYREFLDENPDWNNE